MTSLKTRLTRIPWSDPSLISLAHHSLLACNVIFYITYLYLRITVIFNGNSQKWALLIISFNFLMNFQFAHTGSWPEFQEETPSTLVYNNSTAKGNPAQPRFHQNQSGTLSQHLLTIVLKLFSYHRINLGESTATWMMFLPTAHFLIISHPIQGMASGFKSEILPTSQPYLPGRHTNAFKDHDPLQEKRHVLKASAQILW